MHEFNDWYWDDNDTPILNDGRKTIQDGRRTAKPGM